MRVNKVGPIRNSSTVSKVKKTDATETSFSSLLGEKKQEWTREELEHMMLDIKADGEKLVDERNIEVLVAYKKKIKSFVSKAVDYAFDIQDKKGLSRFGRGKILKIVSQIDDTLVELTENFLDEERARINMLDKIGELQGLLYNIYA